MYGLYCVAERICLAEMKILLMANEPICDWAGLRKIDCSNAASHIRTVHRMRNITVDPLHHRCLKSLHVIKATDDTYGCPNCSRKMRNFAENNLARQMHNSRCEGYRQTVRGLRDLLDKVSEDAVKKIRKVLCILLSFQLPNKQDVRNGKRQVKIKSY